MLQGGSGRLLVNVTAARGSALRRHLVCGQEINRGWVHPPPYTPGMAGVWVVCVLEGGGGE